MKQILSAIKQSADIIRKHKPLAALLFLLQLIFFAVIIFAGSQTLVPSLAHYAALQEYLGDVDLSQVDPESPFTSGMLGDDPLYMYDNIKAMQQYSLAFLGIFLASFIMINGASWLITISLAEKSHGKEKAGRKKQGRNIVPSFLKFFLVSIIYLIMSIILIYSISLQMLAGSIMALLYLIMLIALNYFVFIALSLCRNPVTNFSQRAFIAGSRYPLTILSTYSLNLILKLFLFFLLYISMEQHILLQAALMLLITASFVWSRLLFNIIISDIKKSGMEN